MRILITGANGFIGSHLKTALKSNPLYNVIGLVSIINLDKSDIECALTDKDSLGTILNEIKPQVIFHLAGSFSNQFSTDLKNNVLTTRNILETIAENKLETKVIVMGSASEYGAIDPKSNPIDESHPTCPISIYGLTKVYQTQLCQFYSTTKNVDVIIARLFNVFGTGASERLFVGKLQHKIYDYKNNISKTIQLKNVSSFRDYLHIDQVIKKLITIMEYGIKGEIYNVGSGKPIQILELSKLILKEHGISESAIELIPDDPQTKDNVPIIYANIHKINSLQE